MHPAIPVAGTALLGALAWQLQSFTPAALLSLFALAALQTLHQWPLFYALFAVFFLSTSLVTPVGQSRRTTALHVIASAGVGTALLAVHASYLKQALSYVPGFLMMSSPPICLPRPSQTLAAAKSYSIAHAAANALPFGIVTSYAVAAALTFRSRLGTRMGSAAAAMNALDLLLGLLGALLISATAAFTVPVCTSRMTQSEAVMSHVDHRAVAWGERASMAWTQRERYASFLALGALVGPVATLVYAALAPAKEALANGQPGGKSSSSSSQGTAQISGQEGEGVRQLLTNVLVTGGVVVGLALWSCVGNS